MSRQISNRISISVHTAHNKQVVALEEIKEERGLHLQRVGVQAGTEPRAGGSPEQDKDKPSAINRTFNQRLKFLSSFFGGNDTVVHAQHHPQAELQMNGNNEQLDTIEEDLEPLMLNNTVLGDVACGPIKENGRFSFVLIDIGGCNKKNDRKWILGVDTLDEYKKWIYTLNKFIRGKVLHTGFVVHLKSPLSSRSKQSIDNINSTNNNVNTTTNNSNNTENKPEIKSDTYHDEVGTDTDAYDVQVDKVNVDDVCVDVDGAWELGYGVLYNHKVLSLFSYKTAIERLTKGRLSDLQLRRQSSLDLSLSEVANMADTISTSSIGIGDINNENTKMIDKWKTLNKTCLANIDLSQVILIRKYEYCRQLFYQQSQGDGFRHKNSNRIICDCDDDNNISTSIVCGKQYKLETKYDSKISKSYNLFEIHTNNNNNNNSNNNIMVFGTGKDEVDEYRRMRQYSMYSAEYGLFNLNSINQHQRPRWRATQLHQQIEKNYDTQIYDLWVSQLKFVVNNHNFESSMRMPFRAICDWHGTVNVLRLRRRRTTDDAESDSISADSSGTGSSGTGSSGPGSYSTDSDPDSEGYDDCKNSDDNLNFKMDLSSIKCEYKSIYFVLCPTLNGILLFDNVCYYKEIFEFCVFFNHLTFRDYCKNKCLQFIHLPRVKNRGNFTTGILLMTFCGSKTQYCFKKCLPIENTRLGSDYCIKLDVNRSNDREEQLETLILRIDSEKSMYDLTNVLKNRYCFVQQ